MNRPYASVRPLDAWPPGKRTGRGRRPADFELELTARCNLNCRHCYINIPAGDREAKKTELTPAEVDRLSTEAASLGVLWCLLTGGEPLLRRDFADIYLRLKKKGLLVSVFTNATLVKAEHIRLFKSYPPRDIEVTVYGVTAETYERVTRRPGSFAAFRRGLDLLLASGVPVRLKAMALRSNVHEMASIARFARGRSRGPFRFDPLLHLRYDGDERRNAEIRTERLTAEEIVALERSDPERMEALEKACTTWRIPASSGSSRRLFACRPGQTNFAVSPSGVFRLCASLWHPEFIYDLRRGSLREAWFEFAPRALSRRSRRKAFLDRCGFCSLINLCLWCPAHAYLETGSLTTPVEAFCRVAHARADALT